MDVCIHQALISALYYESTQLTPTPDKRHAGAMGGGGAQDGGGVIPVFSTLYDDTGDPPA